MPPKSKVRKAKANNLEIARSKKIRLESEEIEPAERRVESEGNDSVVGVADFSELLNMSEDALDTDNESVDPTFNLDDSVMLEENLAESFCEDYVLQLDHDQRVGLGIFLSFQLEKYFSTGSTKSAEYAGMMIGRSDKSVRAWKSNFLETGVIPDNKQGKYQRSGVLWSSENLNKKAIRYVRNNNNVKGKPNLTVHSFCEWINEDLLPNETLQPGFPRRISVETARKWLHELGFDVIAKKKGTFVDGHERDDVVEYRSKFLRKMVGLGFLNSSNSPSEDAKSAVSKFNIQPPQHFIDKTVIIFHDESTFQSNDDQPTLWGEKGTTVMRPKSKGSGIMISDFIDEKNGFLALTKEEYDRAVVNDPSIRMYARQFLEYGESREGYWASDKFIVQIEKSVKIANLKYPKSDGWRVVWVFDHSSCHAAMADDSLDVNQMNVKPGGKQRVMRDGLWDGNSQKMVTSSGVPKGLRVVLEERGVNTTGMSGPKMKEVLGNFPDFKYEKSRIERILTEKYGHIVYMLPKYHCELNPIERVWAQAKRYTKAYCKYSLPSLRNMIIPAIDTVTLDNIQNYFRKSRHYMFAYLEGIPGGSDLEKQVKEYKKNIKSHRRISEHQ